MVHFLRQVIDRTDHTIPRLAETLDENVRFFSRG
ncbi:Uncharacterised protein [Vibrio cholerae]|nr:Uncharacterised protein [Vibrio cholerae]CSC44575.1 Uncharacterised protein [Vibrio cholerae]